jgi:hypothetical protein
LPFEASPKKLCQKIGEVLSIFPDQHLKAKYRGTYCFESDIKKVEVGKNLNDSKNPWIGIKDKKGIYTIAISQFTPGKWPGFLEFVREAQRSAKMIIIDLRGNGGGDDSIGFELAEILAGQKIETPIAPAIRRNTLETLQIWENYLNVLKKSSNDKCEKDQLDVYLNENSERMNTVLSGGVEEFISKDVKETNWQYDQTKGFQGKIFILQDKDCASSCESTIDFFEFFPNVTRVGFNTAGMTHFGNVGLFVLPNSSIQINMPTKTNRFKDDRFIEFKGRAPDIVLNEGQNAHDYVMMNLIKGQNL